MSKIKKEQQLGMNPSTASNRLVKDILWKYIQASSDDMCFRCGLSMSRDNFSIEHKDSWLDSEDPLDLYFDLENISFSHLSCNSGASKKPPAKCGTISNYQKGCRCEDCKVAKIATRK